MASLQARWRRALATGGATVLVSLGSFADSPSAPTSDFSSEKGNMVIPLYRGAINPFEITIAQQPNNCANHPDVKIKWDEDANTVHVRLTGTGVVYRNPVIHRTLGVDYFPNQWFAEPQNIEGGRYQFWIVTAGPIVTFYYDPNTLNFIGSEWDFATPPPAIPIQLPSLMLVGSQFFQPNENGDVDFTWDFPYDHVTRGDLPEQFAHHFVSFPPPNLCEVNPYRIDQSHLRPYISPPRPASEAESFATYLKGGFAFDLTTEPSSYYEWPPKTTLVENYTGTTFVGGTVPNGWSFDIEAAFMNNAPPIRPWEGAGTCTQFYTPRHTKNMNFCGGGQ
jgi:hypothetical protein